MRVTLQLVMCSDDGQEEIITDIVTLKKDAQRIEYLGLTLKEAKRFCRNFHVKPFGGCFPAVTHEQREGERRWR